MNKRENMGSWDATKPKTNNALRRREVNSFFAIRGGRGRAVQLSSIGPAYRIWKRGIPRRKSEQVLGFPHDPETARDNL